MVLRDRTKSGVRELLELDLFEISLTPSPANADTRVLEMKALADGRDDPYGRTRGTSWPRRLRLATSPIHCVPDATRSSANSRP
jgi:hypothetical protein